MATQAAPREPKATKAPLDPYDTWIEQNPLRRWRKSNGWSIMRAASSMGCSMTIVQLWERGVHIPSDEYMAQIQRLLGPAAVPEWTRWWNSKPDQGDQP